MAKNEKETIFVNEKEYAVEDLSDTAKKLVNHIRDFDNKLNVNRFTHDGLQLGRQKAIDLLAEEVEKGSEGMAAE
jgi:hypothetical protein